MPQKLRERVKHMELHPFPYYLTIIVSNDIQKSMEKRAKAHNFDATPDENLGACTIGSTETGTCLMFLPEDTEQDWITHESSHVVWYMLHYVRVKLDPELLAYFTVYIAKTIGQFLSRTVIKEKSPRKTHRPASPRV